MTYDILDTGSTGKAVVINGEILIDCGVPMKKLRESGYIKDLRLVLLTCAHSNHFLSATVRTLHRECPALRWGCCEWMVAPLLGSGVDRRAIDVYVLGRGNVYKNLGLVVAKRLVRGVPNCGYCINTHKETLFYVTGTAALEGVKVKGCDYYLIGANHTQTEISTCTVEKRTQNEYSFEAHTEQKRFNQKRAMDWLTRNAGPNSFCAIV